MRIAHDDGEWIAHPTYQEGDESTFEIVVAGRKLDDGDVAIMMVEAGGTEKSLELYAEGAKEGHRGRDRRGPRGVEAVDQGVRSTCSSSSCQKCREANGPIETIEYEPASTTTPDVFAPRSSASPPTTLARR